MWSRIWSYLLKNSLMKTSFFVQYLLWTCAVQHSAHTSIIIVKKFNMYLLAWITVDYSEACQTSMIELLAKIIYDSTLDIWQGSEYSSGSYAKLNIFSHFEDYIQQNKNTFFTELSCLCPYLRNTKIQSIWLYWQIS